MRGSDFHVPAAWQGQALSTGVGWTLQAAPSTPLLSSSQDARTQDLKTQLLGSQTPEVRNSEHWTKNVPQSRGCWGVVCVCEIVHCPPCGLGAFPSVSQAVSPRSKAGWNSLEAPPESGSFQPWVSPATCGG